MSQNVSNAFELLDPRIQRWIWQQNWSELRDIQEQAIKAVNAGTSDVVIASATASGKTEAAFLPIASATAPIATSSLAILCVSPLKALINDQFERLRDIFDAVDVPVHRWHGDVSASHKARLLRAPAGVLLITPESLEALFIRRGSRIPGIVEAVRYIVIDELHSFIGTERGRQLQSLLHRVEVAARRRIPRVALSATLGDMDLACDFLRRGEGGAVNRIMSTATGQEVRLQIRGYRTALVRLNDVDEMRAAGLEESGDMVAIARDLYATLRGGRHIAFANRRADVETYTDLLKRISDAERAPNEFWPHHGSLDKGLREEAERALKAGDRPATIIATTTLELGIDVGSVESIAQIGPPPSVASMRQRLGRSGRRGGPSVLRIYVRELEIDSRTTPQDHLRPDLVQTIAMVRLLAKRWYEPPRAGALHLSTLVQQVLSLVAQFGGITARDAWRVLCETGPFKKVTTKVFAELLRDLGRNDLITQTHDGILVLGLTGERIVNQFDFYSAFTSPEEYRLVSGNRTIGTLPVTFPLIPGMFLLFGGSRWRVIGVDETRRIVELAAAPGGRAPVFGGAAAEIHDVVREEMRAVYWSEDVPAYIDQPALQLLAEARSHFKRFGLHLSALLEWSSDTLLFPWVGDAGINTLVILLKQRGIDATNEGISIRFDGMSAPDVRSELDALMAAEWPQPEILAAAVENKKSEKHHVFLNDDLLAADYASTHLDLVSARRAAEVARV